MFGYIYGNGDSEYKQEIISDNEIFVIDNDSNNYADNADTYNADNADNVDAETATNLKIKYFQSWKDSVESEKINNREDCCSYMGCGYGYIPQEAREEARDGDEDDVEGDDVEGDDENDNEDEDRLNYNDTDETDCENKVYIISLNGIPYFYDENLTSLRNTMWDIANNLLKNSNSPASNYILTNNSNEVKIVSPYNFFWFFNYNHTISELKIDYVIKFPTKQEKQD